MGPVYTELKPMARSFNINWWSTRLLLAILGTSWVTGLLFYTFNNWVRINGPFGPERHPMQQLFLVFHGGSAFLMMVVYGFFLGYHAWPRRKQASRLGRLLIGAIAVSIVSAYGLYYLGDPIIRQWALYTHLMTGFFLPVILFLHIRTMVKGS